MSSEPEGEVPACLQCGTCCFSTLLDYVRVTGDDHERMGERAAELVHFAGNRAFMNMVDGHCAQLQVVVATGELVCAAYSIRPQTCRDLERGSAECGGELAAKRERPLIALGRSALPGS